MSFKAVQHSILGFLFFTAPLLADAQPPSREYFIEGRVQDSALNSPVSGATVYVNDAETLETYLYQSTDSNGIFRIRLTEPGQYFLGIEHPGYLKQKTAAFLISDSTEMVNTGSILLIPLTGAIGEVKITAEKPLIENKADKLVYNASQDISSKGGSATDLMRKVPMVEVDLDGNVSLRGSQNIRVLINGKPSGIVNASIRDALRTIPADEIESIEVITNPSAKYDAEGTAGIINIVMKQSRLTGTSGNIHSGAGNRTGHLGAGITKQFGKTSISFRMGGFYWRNVGDAVTNRENTLNGNTYLLKQTSENNVFGTGPRASFGVDHNLSKYATVSFSATGRGNGNITKSSWNTETGTKNYPLSLLYSRTTHNNSLTLGYDFNADYRRTFKKAGREFLVSTMYNGSSQSSVYDAEQRDSQKNVNYREKSENLGLNNEFTLQADFTEPLSKKLTVETGLKGILRKVTSTYDFDSFSFVNNEYRTIAAQSNDFFYHQNVIGGYAQGGYLINQKLSVKLGTRYEYTTYNGGRRDSALNFTGMPYGNFIPFVSINRVFGYTGFIRLNYTQRLLRPSLFYLNPYTNFSDPRNVTTGNPRLRAEVSNNIEISGGNYTRKGGGSITAYYRRTNNAIESVREVDSFGVYRTTYGNVGLNNIVGADINANFKGKLWMLNLNGGLGYVSISSLVSTGAVGGSSNSGWVYNASIWGFYKFAKQWSVETFARINAPTISLQGKTQNWYFHTIGIKRRFKKDNGGIGVGVDNPFTPHVTYTTIQQGKDFTFNDVRDINMLGIRVNFDYRFGKMEMEQQQKPKKGIKNDDLKPGGNDQGGSVSGS